MLRKTKHTEEGGETSDDGNDEIGRCGDGGTDDSFKFAVPALVTDWADAFVQPFVLVVDASGAVPARPPQTFVHVAARTAVFTLTARATKR